MKRASLCIVAVALLASAAACHKAGKAEQLAALENAYHAGVFSEQEYEAKKAALLGYPARPAVKAEAPQAAAQAAPAPSAPPAAMPAPATTARSKPSPFNPPSPETVETPASPPSAEQPGVVAQASPAEEHGTEPARAATCEDVERRVGKGLQERFFPMPVARVRQAALLALEDLDFKIHLDAGNEIEASKKRHLSVLIGAGGERVVLHFVKVRQGAQEGTRMSGETRKTGILRAGQKSWTAAVLAQTACMLEEKTVRRF